MTPSPRGKRGNMLKQGKTSQLAGLFQVGWVLGARRRREMPTDRGTPVIPSVAPYQNKQQLYPYIRKGGKGDQRAAKKCAATTHGLLAANANKQSLGFPRTAGSRKSDGSATHEQASYRIKPRVRDRVLPLGPKDERVSDQPVVLPDREPLVSSDPACGKTRRCLYIHTYIHTYIYMEGDRKTRHIGVLYTCMHDIWHDRGIDRLFSRANSVRTATRPLIGGCRLRRQHPTRPHLAPSTSQRPVLHTP